MPATTSRAVCDIELAASEIVEEEQRLGALHDKVVDAHGDQIDADAAVASAVDGDLELGAHAIIGGDQDRVLETARFEVEQAAEAAQIGLRTRPPRRFDQRLDGLYQRVARVDIHSGIAVGNGAVASRAGRVMVNPVTGSVWKSGKQQIQLPPHW